MADARSLFQKSKDKYNLQRMTNAAQPSWIPGQIPTVQGASGWKGASNLAETADVPAGQAYINVVSPSAYTKPAAAHEATHVFQNTRNDQFQDLGNALLPNGATSLADYDYGGVAGLQANPQKTVADYNPEQQAQMVQDLTQAQAQLHPGMTQAQLAAWDRTKTALERPIQQLAAVPAQDDSLGGKIDHYLYERGLGTPYARLMGLIAPPTMNTVPQPVPGAPSVALGYANRSKLVR